MSEKASVRIIKMPGCEPGSDMILNRRIQVCGDAQEVLAAQTSVELCQPSEQLTALDQQAQELLLSCQRCERGLVVNPAGNCALAGLTIAKELQVAIDNSPVAVWYP